MTFQSRENVRAEMLHIADLRARQARSWPAGVADRLHFPRGAVALTQCLAAIADETPERVMLHFQGRDLSFAEVDRLSGQCASLLAHHGIGAGDRVALLLGNCPQYIIGFLGILKLGAVVVPVEPALAQERILALLEDSGAAAAIVEDGLLPRLSRAGLRHVFSTGAGEMAGDAAGPSMPLQAGHEDGAAAFLPALLAQAPLPRRAADLTAIAALNYAWTAAGAPRGCIHTQGDMLYTSASYGATGLPLRAQDVVLSALPLTGLCGENIGLILPLCAGATVVLLQGWEASRFMAAAERHRATATCLRADQIAAIVEHEAVGARNLRSLTQTVICADEGHLRPSQRDRWQGLTGAAPREVIWGSAETRACNSFSQRVPQGGQGFAPRPAFAGLPVPGTDFKICDPVSGALLPLGQVGEICIRTPSLLKGYWNNPAASAAALRRGWFHTGLQGALGTQGELYYMGPRGRGAQ